MSDKRLYSNLNKIRLLAAVLYDKGTSDEISEIEKQKILAPLHQRTQKFIDDAINNNLNEVVEAIKAYEADAQSEIQMAKFYQEKSNTAQRRADEIRHLLLNDLIKHGVKERIEKNCIITISEDPKTHEELLNVR